MELNFCKLNKLKCQLLSLLEDKVCSKCKCSTQHTENCFAFVCLFVCLFILFVLLYLFCVIFHVSIFCNDLQLNIIYMMCTDSLYQYNLYNCILMLRKRYNLYHLATCVIERQWAIPFEIHTPSMEDFGIPTKIKLFSHSRSKQLSEN